MCQSLLSLVNHLRPEVFPFLMQPFALLIEEISQPNNFPGLSSCLFPKMLDLSLVLPRKELPLANLVRIEPISECRAEWEN